MGEHMHCGRHLIALISLLLLLVSASASGANQDFLLPDQAFRISAGVKRADSVVESGTIADGLTGLNQSLGLSTAADTLLQPDQAFHFSAEVATPDRLQLSWFIADGTYLYRDKIKLSLADARAVSIGPFVLPAGELKTGMVRPDGSIGAVEVYHHGIDLTVPLLRKDARPEQVTLVARYQGCAERGVCYPPIVKRVSLQLPASGAESPSAAAAQVTPQTLETERPPVSNTPMPISEQDRIAALLAGGNLWAIVPLFFGFGLLLALTPCVFPMIPILSGIIVGQGADITTARAFGLSLAYVLAMALTYTVAGVAAGLFGANIQAAFQNPWVLGAFAMVFVALALSMFGFYELQLPTGLQTRLAELSNRQRSGTLAGVAVMGLLSALIVSPCVAPPLAGALIFIGQTGNAVLGGTALFALSLGMGAPLILIGTSAARLLPRAGAWMDVVKAVFGVLLLGVAIALIERIVPPPVAMVMWALLLICSGVYMGALRHLSPEAGGWSKLWKGLGFALLVYGVAMLVGAAAGGKDTLQPLRGLGIGGGTVAESGVTFKGIKTVGDLDRELAAAEGGSVMLDFYAKWCVSCQEMERDTFSDPAVINELKGFVLLQADVTDNDAQDRALMEGRFGIPGPPAILFFGPGGQELRDYRVVGFESPETFLEHLRRVLP
ncbi:MAG: protein-disulfide reductase DsbD [Chromatiaceae bacterium]